MFNTIALPNTRLELAKLIASGFSGYWPTGMETNVKARNGYHVVSIKFDEKSDVTIKVEDDHWGYKITLLHNNKMFNRIILNRENKTAISLTDGNSMNLVFDTVASALIGVEPKIAKIYDLGEALAELLAEEPMTWAFNEQCNLDGAMMIGDTDVRLELNFDHINRFTFDVVNLYADDDGLSFNEMNAAGMFGNIDYQFGDTRWLHDGSYNYLATGFNACKTWQKLTQDIEKAISLIKG